ncbi:MAG: GAF domain-containing protein [Methanothrix sp.]|nr:GAF domain-containing protein [Methanothrix sp.]
MRFIDYLNPEYEPSSANTNDQINAVRRRILRYIMLFIAGACLVGYLILASTAIIQGKISSFLLYSVLTVLVLIIALHRRIPYKISAIFLLAAIYGSGIYAFLSAGLNGDGKLYMLSFTVLTGVLFGLIPTALALTLSILTTAAFGFGMVGGYIPIPPPNWMASSANGTGWLIATVFLTALGVLTTISLAILIRNLQSALKRQNRLYEEKEKDKASLEQQIFQATQDVERRLVQIRTAADIARSISSLQDPGIILQQVVDQVQQQFNLYYVGVFIVDENQNAVLKAGTGEAGQKMIAAGHRLQVGGTSMIGWCIASRQPRIALDVGSEAVRFNNPNLPETRSELALPILSRGESLGAFTIQSTKANAFDENDIKVLSGIADSLAIALENANLYEQTQQSLDEIRSLNQAYLKKGWAETTSSHGDLRFTFENNAAPGNEANNLIQVPMMLRDQVIGQISLETDKPNLSPDDLEFVEAVTVQTALALENARLIDETQRKAYQEETVNRLSVEFSRGLNIDEIVTAAVKELSHLPSVSEVSIYLSAPEVLSASENNGQNLESLA